ncbi:MAG: hypothetical protein ABL907_08565, partial [Hyphomicrobium sp.]
MPTPTKAELQAEHAECVRAILAQKMPSLAPSQVRAIIAELQSQISDWSPAWRGANKSETLNGMMIDGAIGLRPALVRAVPNASQVRDYLLARNIEDFGPHVSAATEVQIAREV